MRAVERQASWALTEEAPEVHPRASTDPVPRARASQGQGTVVSQTGPEVRVVSTLQALAEEAAGLLRHAAERAVANRGRFTLALSGGQTPLLLYRQLAAAGPDALPYDRMEIFWSDERAVPPDHPDSNYHLVWEAWLAHAPLDARRIHRIRGEDGPAAAPAYEAELRTLLGDPPRLDLILLGVGRDGHTASLFSDTATVDATRLVIATVAPFPPQDRVTFTFPLIWSAATVLVLVAGPDKAQAVRQALLDRPSATIPSSNLRAPHMIWLLDEAAAAALLGGAAD